MTTCLRKDPLQRYHVDAGARRRARGAGGRSRRTPARVLPPQPPCLQRRALQAAVVVAGASARRVGRLRADAVSGLARAGLAATPLGHDLHPHGAGVGGRGTSLRLHVWFTARFVPSEAPGQQAWTRVRTRWCDVAFAALLTAAAVVIAGAHPEFAMLLVAVSTATIVASFVIEPATAHAAFPPPAASASRPPGRTSSGH